MNSWGARTHVHACASGIDTRGGEPARGPPAGTVAPAGQENAPPPPPPLLATAAGACAHARALSMACASA